MGNMEIKYSTETKILSYNQYGFDKDISFYTDEKSKVVYHI